MPMSHASTLPTSDLLTSSAEDFLARTLPSRTSKAPELTASALAFFDTSSDLLAIYNPNSSSWKTSQSCLIEGSETFSERWPKSGTMRNGIAYQRPHWDFLTSVNVSLLLPTPNARDERDLCRTGTFLSARLRHSPSMATQLLTVGRHWSEVSQFYESAMGFPSQWSAGVYSSAVTP